MADTTDTARNQGVDATVNEGLEMIGAREGAHGADGAAPARADEAEAVVDELEAMALALEAADERAPIDPAALPEAALAGSRTGSLLAKPDAAKYTVLACVALLVALTMLGGVLNVGDHLMAAHPFLGGLFYVVLVVVVAIGVVYPLVMIARRPVFSLYQLRDETGHAKRRRCRMLVDNLVANTDLTDEEIARLEGYLMAGDEADDLLIAFFNEKCVPAIDAETKQAATAAFFASAISRSPLVATVTMLSVCLDLVRSIVERCGFRPTNLGLARLYSRVMLSALVAGGIEDSDLSDLLGTMLGGGAGAKAGGLFLGSVAEGVVSAFLVFRVGVITKDWLTSEDGPARMAAIRKMSYRQALSLMRTSGFMATVTDAIKRGVGNVAKSAAESTATAARNAVEATVGAVAGATEAAATSIAHVAGGATEFVGEMTATAASAAKKAADTATGTAKRAVGSLVDRFKDVFGPQG